MMPLQVGRLEKINIRRKLLLFELNTRAYYHIKMVEKIENHRQNPSPKYS